MKEKDETRELRKKGLKEVSEEGVVGKDRSWVFRTVRKEVRRRETWREMEEGNAGRKLSYIEEGMIGENN